MMMRGVTVFELLCVLCVVVLQWAAPTAAEASQSQSSALVPDIFAAPIEVTPGSELEDVVASLRFAPDFNGDLTASNIDQFARGAEFSQSEGANYGSPGTRFLLTLAVTNSGSEPGEWQLLTKRAGLPELTFGEWRDDQVKVLRDRKDADLEEHLQAYHSFGYRVALAPGETRRFVIAFRGVHSSLMPLMIGDAEELMRWQHIRNAVIVASTSAMLVLMLVAALFYLVTAGRHFLWLAIAEFAHAAFVFHVNGYTIHYWLHDKGIWIYSFGWVMPCVYGLAMVQFTRGLLETAKTLPRLDTMLNWLAILLAGTLALISVAAVASSEWLLGLAGYPVPVSLTIYTYGLPIVGVIAVSRLGGQYTPLLVSWVIMAAFGTYFTVAMLDLGLRLPFDSYFYGPIGVVVSLLMTITMVLHMRKIMADKQRSERELIGSLEDRLQLSEDKANAMATINDQHHLIHASGHDSKQVLLALNSMIHIAEQDGANALSPEYAAILRASANQLEAVISTTMDGPIAGPMGTGTVVLSQVNCYDALRQLEVIYRPLAQKKGLRLAFPEHGDANLITDRALLMRVLSNLLSNAVKFTDRGCITVELEVHGEIAAISIRDEGVGMAAELLGRIYDPAPHRVRGDLETEGTGSGLKSSISLVHQIAGEIAIESEVGQGTAITVNLPHLARSAQSDERETMAQLERSGHQAVDLDTMVHPIDIDWDKAVAVAADRSALVRCEAGSTPPVLLLRPLNPDMLSHPVICTKLGLAQEGGRRLADGVVSQIA